MNRTDRAGATARHYLGHRSAEVGDSRARHERAGLARLAARESFEATLRRFEAVTPARSVPPGPEAPSSTRGGEL